MVVGVGLALGGGGRYVVVDGERCAIILVAGSRRAGGAAGRLGVSGTFSKGGRHQSRERKRWVSGERGRFLQSERTQKAASHENWISRSRFFSFIFAEWPFAGTDRQQGEEKRGVRVSKARGSRSAVPPGAAAVFWTRG